MPNLSNLTGGNLQFASVVLSGASGSNSQTFPNAFFKVPFNGVLANPYNLITLNRSLSTLTVPAGLYSITVIPQVIKCQSVAGFNIATRITVNNITTIKWPYYEIDVNSGAQDTGPALPSAGLYLSNSSSVALEQYWSASDELLGISDGESNIFYRMDIWKLR